MKKPETMTVNGLSTRFRTDRRTIKKLLADTPPARTSGRCRFYRVADFRAAITARTAQKEGKRPMANLLRLLVTESTMKTHEFVVEDGLRFFLELAGGLGIPEPAAKKLYLQNWIVSAHRIEKFIGDDCFNSWLKESSGKSLDDLWAGFGFHAAAEHGAPVSFAVPAIIKQIAHEQGIEMANTMTTE